MIISNKNVWVIMSKDRQFIAKGTPRNREIVRIDDLKDNKRYLTYNSENKARSAMTVAGFNGQHQLFDANMRTHYKLQSELLSEVLEPVEIKLIMETV